MKLNVGASDPRGRYRGPEWVNIDASRFFRGGKFRRFVVADGARLPFRDETFDEIHAIHVLEHVSRDKHLPFLSEMRRVLTPEGSGFVEIPDFVACCRLIVDADDGMRDPRRASDALIEAIRVRTVGVYGKGRHEGDWHHWGFSRWGLESLCKSAGLNYSRESDMVSGHHKLEPVLLYRVWR